MTIKNWWSEVIATPWAGGNRVSTSQDESKYMPPESEIMIVSGSCIDEAWK